MEPRFSLVIPCYNEEGNLPGLFARCDEAYAGGDVEVVFVNNGSVDGSAAAFERLCAGRAWARVVTVPVNQGYGFGILSGLREARGRVLGWCHADLQTEPGEAKRGFALFDAEADPDRLFVKGARFGRPLADRLFTWGMSAFEALILGRFLWDINAQPTLFSRKFFQTWDDPPHDFSLDLFAFYQAKRQGLAVRRFPVPFGARVYGQAHIDGLKARLRYSSRTIDYSLKLRKRVGR